MTHPTDAERMREACANIDFGPIFDALQDHVIAMRDARMSMLPAPNGIVVCEKDGKPSSVVRMTTRQAVLFIAERVAAAIRALPLPAAPAHDAVREEAMDLLRSCLSVFKWGGASSDLIPRIERLLAAERAQDAKGGES